MRNALVNWTKNEWLPLWSDMDSVFRGFNDFFDVPLSFKATEIEKFTPPCDVHETPTHYHLQFDLPGVSKDEIKIDLTGGCLTVSGERKLSWNDSKNEAVGKQSEDLKAKKDVLWVQGKEDESEVPRWVERRYGSFRRSIQLPENLNLQYIDASYQNGVLKISLQKKDKEQPKRISIR